MSRIIWTPEAGWTDEGPEVTVGLDKRGRLTTRPVEPAAEVYRQLA